MQEMIKIGNAVQTGVGNGGNCTKKSFSATTATEEEEKKCKTLS